MSDYRAVIIDDDENRRNLIESLLPDYFEKKSSRYDESAKGLILPEDGSEKASIVIMYADDMRNKSTYMFNWMISENRNKRVYKIPVVFITKDMFSDRAYELLEIADARFVECGDEIDEISLFDEVMEALDEAEANEGDDEEIEQYPPEVAMPASSPDRIMGMKFVMPSSDDATRRSVVIKDEEKLNTLMKSVKISKNKAAEVKAIIEKAIEEKIANGEEVKWDFSKESKGEPKTITKSRPSGVIEEPIVKKNRPSGVIEEPEINNQNGIKNRWAYNSETLNDLHNVAASNVSSLLDETPVQSMQNAQSTPRRLSEEVPRMSDIGMQLFNGMPGTRGNASAENTTEKVSNKKYKVFIIDADPKTIKACQLFLDDRFVYESADSSMKAIDYFVKKSADVVIIDYNMPGINGIQILKSVRMQPYGVNVPVVLLFKNDNEPSVIGKACALPKVKGIVMKPITKKQLVATVTACLR